MSSMPVNADMLFPSEEESSSVQLEMSEKKKKRTAKPASSSSSAAKKMKIAPVVMQQHKSTAHDLFGSDSDEDESPPATTSSGKLLSYISRRVANGTSRQCHPTKTGSYFIEMKVYKTQEIQNVTPVNRWRQAIVTIKNQTDDDSDAWKHLTNFIIATRKEYKSCPPTFMIPSTSHSPSYTDNVTMLCDKCQIEIPKREYRYHLRTNLHKSNCLLKTEFKNVEIIASAFKNRIVTYRINPGKEVEYLTPEAFLFEMQSDVMKLIEISLLKHNCIKINFELFAYFTLPNASEQQLKSFNTKYEIVYQSTNIDDFFMNTVMKLKKKMIEFEHRESGWSYFALNHLEININKYNPMRGGTFIELPPIIRHTKSCINIQNNDNHCFLWSIIASLYPAKNNVCRVSSYPHFSNVLNLEGMTFPPTMNDIKLFEKNNPNISINIYGLDKCIVTGPLYSTKSKRENHINLLYIESHGTGHYCLIKDLVRLVRRQVSSHRGKMYFCDSCLQFFASEIKHQSHSCSEVLTTLPKHNTRVQFKNYERQQKIPFVIYADFESMLTNCEVNNKNTTNKKLHIPSCFAYYICCSYDSSLNKYVTYRGKKCTEVFIKRLIDDIQNLTYVLSQNNQMKPLTLEQQYVYENASKCHICKQFLFGDKVRDHDHVTSEFRGAAHSLCNLKYRVCPYIPVIFHNLAGYDAHLFIEELTKYKGPINIIPQSKEKYTSITKIIEPSDKSQSIKIKFIDSYQFLHSSLDELIKNLDDKDFKTLRKEFSDHKDLHLLKQKGIYPYEYIDSWLKYDEKELPCKDNFYNTLKMEHITSAEYRHAQSVWNTFNIRSLGEYTDLYLKCDVLLLCDIFENFRNTSLHHYGLDPAYYVSAPSLSWDAMLLCTGVQLELISDLEIYQMLEKGIRGGLAQCSLRHVKANNKYVPDFDDSKPSTYLLYLDCNNLYGYAMRQKMPVSDFKFLTENDCKFFNVIKVPDDDEYGYILEVDIVYPEYLHDNHCDLPFAPEKFIPPGGNAKKLIANLYNKYNYIIHLVHLKECLKNGLILNKIHRILQFKQESFLQKYIDLNTRLRQNATSTFEKDFFKLLNNAIFGKTIENKRKQVNIKLVSTWKDSGNKTNKYIGAEKLLTKPNVKNIAIFSENLVAIQLQLEKLILDKPIYIGFTVLELAKQHLYQFHYNYIKRKYNSDVKLCYTDTDSLLYCIKTDDIYKDLLLNISNFDTSNYEDDNPYGIYKVNAKVPGIFKDELGGSVITEFVGLRAKLYCLKSVKTTIKKAKGVSKPITNRLRVSDYIRALHSKNVFKCKMNMIKSIKHVLYSQEVNKVVLNSNDDKRQILKSNVETLPWGHFKTIF